MTVHKDVTASVHLVPHSSRRVLTMEAVAAPETKVFVQSAQQCTHALSGCGVRGGRCVMPCRFRAKRLIARPWDLTYRPFGPSPDPSSVPRAASNPDNPCINCFPIISPILVSGLHKFRRFWSAWYDPLEYGFWKSEGIVWFHEIWLHFSRLETNSLILCQKSKKFFSLFAAINIETEISLRK